MDVRNTATIVTLLLAAVGSGVLLLSNTDKDDGPESGPRLSIGYYMTDAQLVGTGDDGKILYRASTKTAAQNFDDDVIKMEGVFVTYDPPAEIPWALRANTGTIPPDGNIIQLTGDVVARAQDAGATVVTIRTDFLELDTETYIANTSHKVAIDYSSNRVFATGMRAYFKEDRLQLISNVNGKFFP